MEVYYMQKISIQYTTCARKTTIIRSRELHDNLIKRLVIIVVTEYLRIAWN